MNVLILHTEWPTSMYMVLGLKFLEPVWNENILPTGWTQRTRTFPWRCCEESQEGKFII